MRAACRRALEDTIVAMLNDPLHPVHVKASVTEASHAGAGTGAGAGSGAASARTGVCAGAGSSSSGVDDDDNDDDNDGSITAATAATAASSVHRMFTQVSMTDALKDLDEEGRTIFRNLCDQQPRAHASTFTFQVLCSLALVQALSTEDAVVRQYSMLGTVASRPTMRCLVAAAVAPHAATALTRWSHSVRVQGVVIYVLAMASAVPVVCGRYVLHVGDEVCAAFMECVPLVATALRAHVLKTKSAGAATAAASARGSPVADLHDASCAGADACTHFLNADPTLLALSALFFFQNCGRVLPVEALNCATTSVSLVLQSKELVRCPFMACVGMKFLFCAAMPSVCQEADVNKMLAASGAVLQNMVSLTDPWALLHCSGTMWALHLLLRVLRLRADGFNLARLLLQGAMRQVAALLQTFVLHVPDCRQLPQTVKDMVAVCILITEAAMMTMCRRTHGAAIFKLKALFGAGPDVLPSYVPTQGTLLAPWDVDVGLSHDRVRSCTSYKGFSLFFKRLFRIVKAEADCTDDGAKAPPAGSIDPDGCIVLCISALSCTADESPACVEPCGCSDQNIFALSPTA